MSTLLLTLFFGCPKQPASDPNTTIVSQSEVEAVAHKDKQAPTETSGVKSVEALGSVLLENEWPDREVKGLELRARKLTLSPGAVVAQHSHEARPGFAVIISGEAIEHRNDSDEPLTRGVGDHSVERPGVTHWWENQSGAELSAVVIDIIPTELSTKVHQNSNETNVDGTEDSAPVESSGLIVTQLERTDLSQVQDTLSGLDFRLRKIVVEAGGVVAVHEHISRPGMVLVLSGEINEHRGKSSENHLHLPGALIVEQQGVIHWWKNNSTEPAVLMSVDITPAS